MIAASGRSRMLAGALLLPLALAAAGTGCTTPSPAGEQGRTRAPVPPPSPAPASAPPAPVPARLVAGPPGASGPSSQCLAQIEAFAEQHSGNRVMLGRAAFADSDQLVLTRQPRRGSDGRPLDGRAAMPQPVVLNLRVGPQGCSVTVAEAAPGDPQAAAGERASAPLPACSCVALSR